MKIGFLFPGQGSQTLNMGKDIYEKYEATRKVYDKVKNITGVDIAKITFEGPEEILNETRYTQLAILTMSLSILEILKEHEIKAEYAAGLSLGEYSALIYSNIFSFEDGVKLVQKRGEYMQNLVPEGDWQMAAVIGLSEEKTEDACRKVKSGFVKPVNFNCPGQIVISGEKVAVDESISYLKENGARLVKPLKTAGPFHTEKLVDSAKALRKELDKVNTNNFECKVVKNLDGKVYGENDDIKEILEKHIISPVRFSSSIETMLNDGVDTFVEIGPGKTLSDFVKRSVSNENINRFSINNVQNLEETIEKLKEV